MSFLHHKASGPSADCSELSLAPGSLWAWPPPGLQAQLGEAAASSTDKGGAGPGAASSAS